MVASFLLNQKLGGQFASIVFSEPLH